jgi:hypothetical protein
MALTACRPRQVTRLASRKPPVPSPTQHRQARLPMLTNTILECDLSVVGKPHYLIPGRLSPRITPTTPYNYLSVRHRSFGHDTVCLRAIASHRNNRRPDQSFGKDGSNTVALGFLRKVLVPAGGFEMPRYFLHVKRGQVTVLDQEGIELGNATQAEEEAARRAQQCLVDDAWNGKLVSRGMIIVDDENWRRLFELPF